MVALRLGALSAVGIDVDPVAIACARDYAAANGFGDELSLIVGDPGDRALDGRYAIIVANLDQRTLCREAARIAARLAPGGTLVVSGLLGEDLELVSSTYASLGGIVDGWREQDGWVAEELRFPG